MEKRYKIIVAVDVHCPVDGDMVPTAITWEDGTIYLIDRVLDVRRAASLKAGGQGLRYTVRIRGTGLVLHERVKRLYCDIHTVYGLLGLQYRPVNLVIIWVTLHAVGRVTQLGVLVVEDVASGVHSIVQFS